MYGGSVLLVSPQVSSGFSGFLSLKKKNRLAILKLALRCECVCVRAKCQLVFFLADGASV